MGKFNLKILLLCTACFLSLGAIGTSIGAIVVSSQAQSVKGDTGEQGQKGEKGEDGIGITSIEKTSSNENIDIYTITFSDGKTQTFQITNGKDGAQGIQGLPGEDGKTPEIKVGDNGNWFIDGVDSQIKAIGVDGSTPYIGENGNWRIDGKDTNVSASGPQGETGENGLTPYIGTNGNWWIGNKDTGIKAQGPQGETGNGISKIELTSTNGNVDTYTITYTNGETTTFKVTNGVDGAQGIQGEPGEDGHTPVITIGENGNWFIDGVDSGFKAQGPQGETGNGIDRIEETSVEGNIKKYTIYFTDGTKYEFSLSNGESAYEIYKKYFPEYAGSEEDWINSLINGEFNKVTVTFDANGGQLEGSTSIDIICGRGISDLPTPTKVGKVFLGWYTGWGVNDVQIKNNDPINNNITLIAKWNEYDIQFVNDEGILLEKLVVQHGDVPVYSKGIPNKLGDENNEYVFSGWSPSLDKATKDVIYKPLFVENNLTYGNLNYKILRGPKKEYISITGLNTSCEYLDIPSHINFAERDIEVTTIGKSAFYRCNFITSVNIPDSVTTIGDHAFDECSSLTSINIPDSVTTIGDHAFSGCSSLTSINIPDGVTKIGSVAFMNCENLSNVTFGENSQLASIDQYTFAECSSLDSIEIPDSVTIIYDNAFESCSNLKEVTFGDNSQLVRIDRYAFSRCSSLTSINIPNYVSSIGSYAFYSCSNLVEATIHEDSRLKNIGEYAFSRCSSLTSINIPNYVSSIGSYAFVGCQNLADVTFGEKSQLNSIGEYAFSNCSSLTSIFIPDTVTTIGLSAFDYCSSLVIYCEAESEPSDWTDSWYGQYEKAKVVLVGGDIIFNEDYAYVVRSNNSEQYIEIVRYLGDEEEVVIPNTINYNGVDIPVALIGFRAFYGNNVIKSVTIDNNVTSIGPYSFYNCSNLVDVTFKENSQLTLINSGAFENCSNLRNVSFGENSQLTTIATLAFASCSNLVNITFGENSQLTLIDAWAFSNCSSLTSISIPDSVAEISVAAFEECSNLKAVLFGENSQLTSIGMSAFAKCSSLTSIFLPDSVTTIDSDAFNGCISLTIYCEVASKPNGWDNNWYRNGPQIVFVDGDIIINEDYAYVVRSINGEQYIEIVRYLGDEEEVLVPNTINYNGVDIPVTLIGKYAFSKNNIVKSVIIGDNVTSIDSYAFSNCLSMTSILISDSVTLIGENAFSSCSNLVDVKFGENSQLESIGSSAFSKCSSLTSIFIPDSVITIGSNAFYGCTALTIYCEVASKPNGWDNYWYGYDSQFILVGGDIIINEDYAYVVRSINGEQYIEIVRYLGDEEEVVVPNTVNYNGADIPVTLIGKYAFYKNNIVKSVIIGDNVTSIDSYAFSNCLSMTSISISDSVTLISENAFSGCSNLVDVKFGENSQLESIGSSAFSNCSSLTFINIPNSVTSIGYSAFSNCSSLTSINIPKSVTVIDVSAFKNCSSLTSIFIPDSVTTIGYGAFDGCTSLIIYCESLSRPSMWDIYRNISNCSVVRGYVE